VEQLGWQDNPGRCKHDRRSGKGVNPRQIQQGIGTRGGPNTSPMEDRIRNKPKGKETRGAEPNQIILESEESRLESDGRKSSGIKKVIVLAANLFRESEDIAWLVSNTIGYKYCMRRPKDTLAD
jgi:hypothetical protein